MISNLLDFSVKITLSMTCLFLLHTFVLRKMGFLVNDEFVMVCYLFNSIVAIFLFLLFFFVSKHNPSILGWFFLLTSTLKFMLFFQLIYPNFQEIETLKKLEFSSFFIPYTIAVSLEIYQLIKILNR